MKEMKDNENFLPDQKTLSAYEKMSHRGFYYCIVLMILSTIFTFVYIALYTDDIYEIEIDGEWVIMDLFVWLGFISMIFLSLPVILALSSLKERRKEKKEKRKRNKEKKKKNLKEKKQKKKISSKKKFDDEPEDWDETIDSFKWYYGMTIIYLLIYVVGIIFILFIPSLQETMNFQTFLNDNLVIIIFWVIFSIMLLISGLEFIPKWYKIKKLGKKT